MINSKIPSSSIANGLHLCVHAHTHTHIGSVTILVIRPPQPLTLAENVANLFQTQHVFVRQISSFHSLSQQQHKKLKLHARTKQHQCCQADIIKLKDRKKFFCFYGCVAHKHIFSYQYILEGNMALLSMQASLQKVCRHVPRRSVLFLLGMACVWLQKLNLLLLKGPWNQNTILVNLKELPFGNPLSLTSHERLF